MPCGRNPNFVKLKKDLLGDQKKQTQLNLQKPISPIIYWCVRDSKRITIASCLNCGATDEDGQCDYQMGKDQFDTERPDLERKKDA